MTLTDDMSERAENKSAIRWLALFALAYGTLHHQGFVLGRLGDVSSTGTRWADWIDIVTPYLVIGPAALAMANSEPTRRAWSVFAVGAIAYTQGHGIHLSANSIGNESQADGITASGVTHLWDEIVGHYLWYGGLTIVVVALSMGFSSLVTPRRRGWLLLLGFLFGTTYATNALEGHTAVAALLSALALVGWSTYRGAGPGIGKKQAATALLVPAFAPAILILTFYGIWHRGFPEPSAVGWNPLGP